MFAQWIGGGPLEFWIVSGRPDPAFWGVFCVWNLSRVPGHIYLCWDRPGVCTRYPDSVHEIPLELGGDTSV